MLANEASHHAQCPDCSAYLVTKVLKSAAGYYLGAECNCGPHSRESDYFRTSDMAAAELEFWNNTGVRPHGRTPGYWGGGTNG